MKKRANKKKREQIRKKRASKKEERKQKRKISCLAGKTDMLLKRDDLQLFFGKFADHS